MDSKIVKPRQSLLERFMMHWLNLILKSDQGLVLRQTRILRSNRYQNLQKQNNQDFFLHGCLILAYISPKADFLSPCI